MLTKVLMTMTAMLSVGIAALWWLSHPVPEPKAQNFIMEYTGEIVTLKVDNFDRDYMIQSGQVSATEVGDYSVTYTLKDPESHKWTTGKTDPVTIDWKIVTAKISKPEAYQTYFDYDQEAKVLDAVNYDPKYITQTGQTYAIEPGIYTATYSLNSNGLVWTDGTTEPVNITWGIYAVAVPKPVPTQTTFEYDNTYKFLSSRNYDGTNISISGRIYAKEPGVYVTIYSLKSNIYRWEDGSSSPVNITWRIVPGRIAKPEALSTEYVYDGNPKTLNVGNYDERYMTRTGTITAQEKGEYLVTYTLNTREAVWSDGSRDPVNIAWSINTPPPPAPPAPIILNDPGDPHWMKSEGKNAVYFWNDGYPLGGAKAIYYGKYREEGNYKYADGEGKLYWYEGDMLITRVDEGNFSNGRPHGEFTHKSSNGSNIMHSHWNQGLRTS